MAILGVAAMLAPLAPVAASEVDRTADESAASSAIGMSDKRLRLDLDRTSSHHLWVNSAAGLAYYLDNLDLLSGYREIVAVDTESGEETSRQTLRHKAYASLGFQEAGSGYDEIVTVDEAGGRLFVSTTADLLGQPLGHTSLSEGRTCAAWATWAESHCVTGVSVLDAVTLEHRSHIPLRSLQFDAPILGPQLVGLSFAPADDDAAAKLHLVVQESPYTTRTLDSFGGSRWNTRQMHNFTFVVQLDVESGQQDWIVRLDACRGTTSGATTKENAQRGNSPHRAAVFRSVLQGDEAVYVACLTAVQSYTGGVVRIPLDEAGMATVRMVPEAAALQSGGMPEDPGAPGEPAVTPSVERAFTVEGPDRVTAILADPPSGRIVMQVRDGRPSAMVWYVFDTSVMQFIGTIGIGGPVAHQTTLSGLSSDGRLYTLMAPITISGETARGGLYVADIRLTPVPQALHFPQLAKSYPALNTAGADTWYRYALSPQGLAGGGARLWMPSKMDGDERPEYLAIEDGRPLHVPSPVDATGRTLDLEEAPGVTESAFDGVARGYGFRALLIAGAEGAARVGPADPLGQVAQCNDPDWKQDSSVQLDPWDLTSYGAASVMRQVDGRSLDERGGPCHSVGVAIPTQCFDGNREVVFAFAGPQGPAIVDGTGARGAAEPFYVDSLTTTDASAPASRCTGTDWNSLWQTALFGRAPADEPSASDGTDRLRLLAECLSSSETTSEQAGDPVTRGYSAQVTCEEEEASGHAYARGIGVDGVTVSEALSSFRVYRDPARGIVSRVESVARGISIPGLIRIDGVRGVAESWANGRAFSQPSQEERASYEPNCDVERTAGTCFQRHLFGVWTPGYQCGPCGDEQAFLHGVNAVVNPYMSLRLRDPDHRLRIGAENGFNAAIQKPEHERFADLVLNLDLMQTTLPTLEIIRHAPPSRPGSREGARGRQIYQFAGVEVSSSYGIQCLLVYDEVTGTCSEAPLPSGSLSVSLVDAAGEPLAGGVFEVRSDADVDGVVGLLDELVGDGACVTAADGIGTCAFDNLEPGSYLVSQTAAPPGYSAVAEPWVSEVAAGEARTVTFTNASDVSVIEVSATDAAGNPVEGATFAVFPDPDADGKIAPDAQAAATCTTDASGVCAMEVPAGSYVLVQTVAPAGLEAIEPVAFAFASGGQIAAVGVTNASAGTAMPEAPPAQVSPVYAPPNAVAPPVESIGDAGPKVQPPAPQVSVPERVGGTVTQVIRAPGDALRLLTRDPLQALAWVASLVLFALAAVAVARRRQAIALIGR